MFNDEGTEAEYLDSQSDGYDFEEEDREEAMAETRKLFRSRYEKAGKAKVGSTIACATCGKKIKKTSYQKKFCRNKGRSNCKDRYWNSVDEVRSQRAMQFNS